MLFFFDLLLQRLHANETTTGIAVLFIRTAVAVRGIDLKVSRNQRAELGFVFDQTGGAHRPIRDSVIRTAQRNDFIPAVIFGLAALPVVLAGHL